MIIYIKYYPNREYTLFYKKNNDDTHQYELEHSNQRASLNLAQKILREQEGVKCTIKRLRETMTHLPCYSKYIELEEVKLSGGRIRMSKELQ